MQGEKVEIFVGYRGIVKKKPIFIVVYRQYEKGPEPIAITEASDA